MRGWIPQAAYHKDAMNPAAPILTSRNNPRVKQLRAALAGNALQDDGLLAIEGEHLIAEAMRSGLTLRTLFLDESRAMPEGAGQSVEVVRLARDVFASITATESPQGIAALVETPNVDISTTSEHSPLLLIAAGLQDPGNFGTLIRSAEAFGATGILTTPGTVSIWNQKTMRASAGSVFRVPVQVYSLEKIAALRRSGIQLLAAVAEGGVTPDQTDLRGGCALMIGNEGAGLSAELLALADAWVTLRCPGPVESLNAAVAGSLLLYEASRQRAIKP